MNTKNFLLAAAISAVLLAAACSTDSSDSSPATTATAAGAGTTAATQPEAATTATEAAEAQGPPSAMGADETSEPAMTAVSTTTTASASTTSTTTTTATSVPTEEPETSGTSTTAARTPETTTLIEGEEIETPQAPRSLQIRVLNGSGVPGAAGELTGTLSRAGYVVLTPANAPRRYSSSAVYYAQGWKDEAAQILAETNLDEIDAPTPVPPQFAEPDARVIVLLGTDTAPAPASPASGLRPRQRNDVALPLADDVPRDRYVPGLANVNIYTPENENDPEVFLYTDTLARALGSLGTFADERWSPVSPRAIEARTTEKYQTAIEAIEQNLEWLGFTPQNTCGAPAGYSFADLLQRTREWADNLKTYGGDAIFTTDRLLELHGGERVNPEANLEFYIRQAAQTAYDSLRLAELSDEIEAPQMILCDAWKLPSGEIPEAANAYWYALLTPGIQPRESLLSQGTYHIKEISRNGNFAFLIVCHPTIGERYVRLWWREAGYRAEVTGDLQNNGCQATYEIETYREDTYGVEDIFVFSFGERVFSAGDLQGFPRS